MNDEYQIAIREASVAAGLSRTRLHKPSNISEFRYQARLGYVRFRFDAGPMQALYGLDPSISDGVDPGCLDAPDFVPAGGMESLGEFWIFYGARQQIEVPRLSDPNAKLNGGP